MANVQIPQVFQRDKTDSADFNENLPAASGMAS
jgi:hypothetical protein